MAHSLGLKVVAEGMETLAQLETLQQNHCNEVQGDFFSRPLPAEEANVPCNAHAKDWFGACIR